MNIILKPKKFKKIKNDDDFYETWQRVSYLDGYANALCEFKNGEFPVIKNPDKERNRLINLMNKYTAQEGMEQEVIQND